MESIQTPYPQKQIQRIKTFSTNDTKKLPPTPKKKKNFKFKKKKEEKEKVVKFPLSIYTY